MTKIKDKRQQAKQAQFFSLTNENAAPPAPRGKISGYFKVARFVPLLAPSFQRRWVEVQGGEIFVAETRGAVMRLLERRANPEVKTGRAYDRDGEVVIDCAYIDEVRPSTTGNAAGTKFEVTTLTESWYFKGESKEAAGQWQADIVLWRDHTNYVLYEKNFADIFADPSEEAAAHEAAAKAKKASKVGGEDSEKKKKKKKATSREGSLLDPLSSFMGGGGGEADGGKKQNKKKSGSMRKSKKSGSELGGEGTDNPLAAGGDGGDGAPLSEGGSTVDYQDGLDEEAEDEDPDSGTDEEDGGF
jgi:hypothetical protein